MNVWKHGAPVGKQEAERLENPQKLPGQLSWCTQRSKGKETPSTEWETKTNKPGCPLTSIYICGMRLPAFTHMNVHTLYTKEAVKSGSSSGIDCKWVLEEKEIGSDAKVPLHYLSQ